MGAGLLKWNDFQNDEFLECPVRRAHVSMENLTRALTG